MLNTTTVDLFYMSPAHPSPVIFESHTPQTTEVVVPFSGLYELTLVGGGGGADGGCRDRGRHGSSRKKYTRDYPGRGGGSGAAFRGLVFLQRGSYIITVGSGGAGGPRVGGKGGARGADGGMSQFYLKSTPAVSVQASGGTGAGNPTPSSCAYHGSHAANNGVGGQINRSASFVFNSISLSQNGLNGNGSAGGNSVYSGTNYGAGGTANSGAGIAGYVRLAYA